MIDKIFRKGKQIVFFTLATQDSNFQKKSYTAALTNCLRGEAVAKFPKVSMEGIFKVSLRGKCSVQRHFRSEDSIHF